MFIIKSDFVPRQLQYFGFHQKLFCISDLLMKWSVKDGFIKIRNLHDQERVSFGLMMVSGPGF